ncbi:hypothetical protein Efla_001481 [Eimeria flavescens]
MAAAGSRVSAVRSEQRVAGASRGLQGHAGAAPGLPYGSLQPGRRGPPPPIHEEARLQIHSAAPASPSWNYPCCCFACGSASRDAGPASIEQTDEARGGRASPMWMRPTSPSFLHAFQTLEVNDNSRRLAAFLNHQVILLLDTAQVPPEALEMLQQRMLDLFRKPAREQAEVLALLYGAKTDQEWRGPAEKIAFELLRSSGFSVQEPFLRAVAAAAEAQCLRLLKHKARIFVEGHLQKGAYLFGVVDPTQTLLYDHGWRQDSPHSHLCAGLPEVYVHLSSRPASTQAACEEGQEQQHKGSCTSGKRSTGSSCCAHAAVPIPCGMGAPDPFSGCAEEAATSEVLSGVVAVVKSPCMHPGDLQLCYAVGIDALPPGSPLRAPLERPPSTHDPDPAAFALRDLLVFPPPPVGPFPSSSNRRWPPLNSRHPAVLRRHPRVEYYFRDVPNMLSGGDLDGDRYWVLWEPAIVGPLFKRWQQGLASPPAATHEPPSADAAPNEQHPAATAATAAAAATAASLSGTSSMSDSEVDSDASEDTSNATAASTPAAAPPAAAAPAVTPGGGAETLHREESESEATTAASLLPPPTPTAISGEGAEKRAAGALKEKEAAGRGDAAAAAESRQLRRLAGFFMHVQQKWRLGVIAKNHIRSAHSPVAYYAASSENAKAHDAVTLALADLAAAAVDAPKTGVMPRAVSRKLRCLLTPHFLVKLGRQRTDFGDFATDASLRRVFASRSILGSLFDRVVAASSLLLAGPQVPLLAAPNQQAPLQAGIAPHALRPLRVRTYWEGLQHKEEARQLFSGDGRVHVFRVEVTLPGALVVGGPSLSEEAPALQQQADSKPTLTALLFYLAPPCPTCTQRRPSSHSNSNHTNSSSSSHTSGDKSSKGGAAHEKCCLRLPLLVGRGSCLTFVRLSGSSLPHVTREAAAVGAVRAVSLQYRTTRPAAARQTPAVFSPPTHLPFPAAWPDGIEDDAVYVHCAAEPADLEALRDAINVQLVAVLPPSVTPSVLLQRLSPLVASTCPAAKTHRASYRGLLGGDSSSRGQLHAFLFRRGLDIGCCVVHSQTPEGRQQRHEQQQQPLAVLSATPQDVHWADWRYMPWLSELEGDLFLLRCLSISPPAKLHAHTCSMVSSSRSCSCCSWDEADADMLVAQLTKILVGAADLQQAKAVGMFPQLEPQACLSVSPPVAAIYEGGEPIAKRTRLFILLDGSLTGLCLRLLLSDLLAALPPSWPPRVRTQRVSHALGLKIQLPALPGLPLSVGSQLLDFSKGAMDGWGAATLLRHHWQHRRHLLLQLQQQPQQQQRLRGGRAAVEEWISEVMEGRSSSRPKDVLSTSSGGCLVFSSGWEASCFLARQAKGLNLPPGIVVSRPPLPAKAQLSPTWARVHPAIKAAAAQQQETLDRAEEQARLPPASLQVEKEAAPPPAVLGVCPPAAFDSSSVPLCQLPSWHLRRRGVATQAALVSLLEELYKGALPLPLTAAGASSWEGAPPLSASGAPAAEVAIDLDIISWCPSKLLAFGRQVAALKAEWDREVTRLMLRFGVEEEAALLAGLVEQDEAGPLGHMDSWARKLQLAVGALHACFRRRRFFNLALEAEEKKVVAVSAYYFSYVHAQDLEAFLASGDRLPSSPAMPLPSPAAAAAAASLLPQSVSKQQQQQQQQRHQQQNAQGRQHHWQQQRHLFSFPWLLYPGELADVKAEAAASAAL